eukprot:gene6421-6917_t
MLSQKNARLVIALLIVLAVLCLCVSSASSSISSNAPIPQLNKKGKGLFTGNSLINRLVREAKISFCSELEGLTLQLTRPSNAEIPLTQIQDFITFINHEYENPDVLISSLIKLSRKFAESNIFTQLKTCYILHYVMDQIDSKAKLEWSKAIHSMRSELDEKLGRYYFSLENISEAMISATTVMELEAVDFTRSYAQYVFKYIEYQQKRILASSSTKNSNKKVSTTSSSSIADIKSLTAIVELAEKNMKLLETNNKLQELNQKVDSEIMEQIFDHLLQNQVQLLQDLIVIYENNANLDSHLDSEIIQLIQFYQPSFSKIERITLPDPVVSVDTPVSESRNSDKGNDQPIDISLKKASEESVTENQDELRNLEEKTSSAASSSNNKPSKNEEKEKQTIKKSEAKSELNEVNKKGKGGIPSGLQKSLSKSIGITPTRLPSGPQSNSNDNLKENKEAPQTPKKVNEVKSAPSPGKASPTSDRKRNDSQEKKVQSKKVEPEKSKDIKASAPKKSGVSKKK